MPWRAQTSERASGRGGWLHEICAARCPSVSLCTKRSECTPSQQSLVCATGHQLAKGLCTVLSSTLPRQLTGPAPREKRKKGSEWVAHPCLSPDVLEPPTAWARAEQRQTLSSNRRQAPVCSTRNVARALPLSTLEPNPTGRVALLSPPAHWDRSPWSFPRLFLPISPEQIADCPRLQRHD